MFSVYVIRSQKNGTRCVGQTVDLKKRISEHNSGLSKYTKNKGPWQLIYQETYDTRSEAMLREKYLKTGVGREFLNNLPK